MRIAFLGDTALIGKYSLENCNIEEIKARFVNLETIFLDCDYVVANLEAPLTEKKTTKEHKTLALKTSIQNVAVLKSVGINCVSLANNHIFDYGEDGVISTISSLSKNGIEYFGIDQKSLMLRGSDGILVNLGAFCCFSTNGWHYDLYGKGRLNTMTKDAIQSFLDESKTNDAYPILVMHWGQENTHYPNWTHVRLADELLSKYKTTIIGHHPHVIQGIKEYENGIAAFSLGNFCFDDHKADKSSLVVHQTEDNKESLIVIVEISENKNIQYEYITIQDNGEKFIIVDNDKIRKYSEYLDNVQDIESYELLRKEEQKVAKERRLGRRDLKWLVSHMNYNSIMCVCQRKINQKHFNKESESFYTTKPKDIVLYMGNFDKPDINAAGKRVYGNALAIRDLGYEVFLLGKHKGDDRNCTSICPGIVYKSFPQYRMIHSKKYLKWMKSYLSKNELNPILIIRYGSPSLSIFDVFLRKYAEEIKVPIITDVVDWLQADGHNPFFNIIKKFDTYLAKGVFYKKSDAIIAISSYLASYYSSFIEKIVIIPPLVDEYNSTAVAQDIDESVEIVYAGSPFRKGRKIKNPHIIKDRIDLAVEATMAAIDLGANIKLNIYGLTEEEYLTAFPNDRKVLNYKQIAFHGFKPMLDVKKAVSLSDFSILLREKNRASMAGFPTKIVESLSCGTPVITTDTSDLKQYIKDSETGFIVDIDSFDNLVQRFITIANLDHKTIQEMKNKCARMDAFYYKNYLDDFADLLSRVCV